MLNAPDEEHLRFAISQGRSIFTQDADFLRLHARQIKHRGIIYTHQKTPTKQIIQGLMRVQDLAATESLRRRESPEYKALLAKYEIGE